MYLLSLANFRRRKSVGQQSTRLTAITLCQEAAREVGSKEVNSKVLYQLIYSACNSLASWVLVKILWLGVGWINLLLVLT